MLVVDFLLKHDFNLDKVEDNLWNLASLIDQKEFLSSKEKQKMYEEARAPVRALKEEIERLRSEVKELRQKVEKR
jgi:cell division protein FtsB